MYQAEKRSEKPGGKKEEEKKKREKKKEKKKKKKREEKHLDSILVQHFALSPHPVWGQDLDIVFVGVKPT